MFFRRRNSLYSVVVYCTVYAKTGNALTQLARFWLSVGQQTGRITDPPFALHARFHHMQQD